MRTNTSHSNKILRELALGRTQRVFALGVSDSRITLYRQQVRAFNLAFALHERHLRNKTSKFLDVAVIGAGASGVTFSAAMLSLGHHVHLFERQQEKMFMQKGCETRYIHPNSYDWPEYGSEFPFADLPFLRWRAATAASVARQILERFESAIAPSSSGRFFYIPQSLIQLTAGGTVDWQSLKSSDATASKAPIAGIRKFAAVVSCAGFGVESEVDDQKYFSYWRNDSFNQVRTDAYAASRADYWVSGTGDGALIDVQRLTIQDFDQSRFVFDVWRSANSLVHPSDLREFHKSVLSSAKRYRGSDKLYRAIDKHVNSKVVSLLDAYLEKRHRSDTFVVLNGKNDSFKNVLTGSKQSFLNALVCHRLYNLGAFVYVKGELKRSASGEWLHPKLKHHRGCTIIVRHGADRIQNLRDCGWTAPVPKRRQSSTSASRCWPVGWWQRHAIPSARSYVSGTQRDRVEFFSPDLQTLYESYVSALSGLVKASITSGASSANLSYRICLHRLVAIQDKYYYQQVTRYFGEDPNGKALEGLPGRVFDLQSGLVGLACLMRKTIVLKVPPNNPTRHRGKSKTLQNLWEDLKLAGVSTTGGMRKPPTYARTFMAVPVLLHQNQAQTHAPKRVGFVLYLDSASDLFGTAFAKKGGSAHQTFLKFIQAAFQSFRGNLMDMAKDRRGFFNDLDVPVSTWSQAKNTLRSYANFVKADPFTLELPDGITADVVLNRFDERGL